MPSDFTYDAGPNVATKSNLVGLPAGADASKYLAASDVNILSGAAGSLRDAIIQGRYHGLTSTPDAPVSVAGGVSLRANDGDLEISLDGSDYESLFGIIIGDSASKVDGHGNGAVNRVALWSDANTVSSDSGLTYASGVLFSKNSLGTDALKLQQSAVHEATRFSLLQPGGGATDYRLTIGVRDNFVGTPQDASLFFQSDGTYPFKFFMGDTNVFSVDQDGIGKVAGYLGVNGMTGDSTFPLNVGGAVIANNVANGSSYGLTMSNGVDSTWTVIPVGSGQVRMKNDSGGRWMSIADGVGSVDAFAVRGGHVIIGDSTCTDDGVHVLQVTGASIVSGKASFSDDVNLASHKKFYLNGDGGSNYLQYTTDGILVLNAPGNGQLNGNWSITNTATIGVGTSSYMQLIGGDSTQYILQAFGTNTGITLTPSGTGAVAVPEGVKLSLNGTTKTGYLASDASTHTLKHFSAAADGSSAVAHAFDTSVAFSNATAKLVSGRNNGTEKFFFDYAGQLSLRGAGVYASGLNVGGAGPIVAAFQNNVDAYNTPPQCGIGFTVRADSGGTDAYMGQIIAGKLDSTSPGSGSDAHKKGFVDCYASGPLWTNIQVWRAISDGPSTSRFLINTTTDNGTNALQVTGSGLFSSTVAASNLSGTNTGDITVGTFGSSPTANGASLSSQVLTLQPADATHPGSLTIAAQAIVGVKTLSDNLKVTEGKYISFNAGTDTSKISSDATTHTMNLLSACPDGSSALGYLFDTNAHYVTGGAVHSYWKSAGNELMKLDVSGNLTCQGNISATTAGILTCRQVQAQELYGYGGGTTFDIHGSYNDGATAVAIALRSMNAFTTSGAKLVSFRNSTTEVHAVDLYGKEIHTNVSGKARSGVATLSGGTATVTTASVKTASKIRLTHQGTGTVLNFGIPYVGTITNSTSFVINSTNALDDDVILWEIIEVA